MLTITHIFPFGESLIDTRVRLAVMTLAHSIACTPKYKKLTQRPVAQSRGGKLDLTTMELSTFCFLASFSGNFSCRSRPILIYVAWPPKEINLKFSSLKLSFLKSWPEFKMFALRGSLVLPKLYSIIKGILNLNG